LARIDTDHAPLLAGAAQPAPSRTLLFPASPASDSNPKIPLDCHLLLRYVNLVWQAEFECVGGSAVKGRVLQLVWITAVDAGPRDLRPNYSADNRLWISRANFLHSWFFLFSY